MQFVWDAAKAAANKKKHGVTFEEAQTGNETRTYKRSKRHAR